MFQRKQEVRKTLAGLRKYIYCPTNSGTWSRKGNSPDGLGEVIKGHVSNSERVERWNFSLMEMTFLSRWC